MFGPVDPSLIMPGAKLPRPRNFEDWRERLICKVFGKLSQADFDFAFDTVVSWMKGKEIDIDQAQYTTTDIFLAMAGVMPGVIVQTCEESGVTLLTVNVRAKDGRALHSRTRRIEIGDPFALSDEPVRLTKVAGGKR